MTSLVSVYMLRCNLPIYHHEIYYEICRHWHYQLEETLVFADIGGCRHWCVETLAFAGISIINGRRHWQLERLQTRFTRQLIYGLSTAYLQLIGSLSAAFPQLFHSFSTAFPQLFQSVSTAFPLTGWLFHSFSSAYPQLLPITFFKPFAKPFPNLFQTFFKPFGVDRGYPPLVRRSLDRGVLQSCCNPFAISSCNHFAKFQKNANLFQTFLPAVYHGWNVLQHITTCVASYPYLTKLVFDISSCFINLRFDVLYILHW